MPRFPDKETKYRGSRDIETATSPETAITIITEEECAVGLAELKYLFNELFPDPDQISVIPILGSGLGLGQKLTEEREIDLNTMRMAYTREDTSRLPKPICKQFPDIDKILCSDGTTRTVVFTECVVDSQETVVEAMEVINAMIDEVNECSDVKYLYPDYFTFAWVSKIGDNDVRIPNLIVAYKVHPDIWVGGLGCDLPGDKAREFKYLVGILSPFAKTIPARPYFTPSLSTWLD